jgi:type IV pilus assembly protein PilY1
MLHIPHFVPRRTLMAFGACALVTLGGLAQAQTTIPLADQPLFTNNPVPGNLALPLSVEFPTAVSVAHIGNYSSATVYLGYFDPGKCYVYRSSATDSTGAPNIAAPDSYFYPDGTTSSRTCTNKWSGNFLNWATMQTIDPFRWALTGGYRVIDTPSLTVIEKAWASGQGGTGNFPNRSITTAAVVSGATPLTALTTVHLRVQGLGNKLRFSSNSANLDNGTATNHYNNTAGTAGTVYEVFARVKVCDTSASAGGVESNCRVYGANQKPEGLIQRYSDRIRYSAFGYLNDSSHLRDGGVLRARQKFVGPTQPVVGSPSITNPAREWDADTGVFIINPDSADAATTTTVFGVPVANSGVINYLNKFGRGSGTYKTYDPVGELYYAAVRYFKNLGNVSSWTNMDAGGPGLRTQWVDNFPVITTWDDPIQYSCQRNFILGIGDANTHADKNVPGANALTANEPTKPAFGDTLDAVTATNRIGLLEGIGGGSLGTVNPYNGCCTNNSALMAGIAYDVHTRDIRPDVNTEPNTLGRQTISTYWLDVMEYQTMKPNNQFLLAAKYGGFEVPEGFNPYTNTTPLPQAWWRTTTDVLPNGGAPRPDNYFTAGAPDQMISGLTRAFADIASRIRAYTTSFSTTLPQVAQTGNGSYSTLYDSQAWTGEVQANILNFDTVTGDPALVQPPAWVFSTELATQASGNGWDVSRRIASWDPASRTAVAFRASGTSRLTNAQLSALDTAYDTAVDSTNYLNYLRGDRTHEIASTAAGSTRSYRTRSTLVGDIEGSKAVPVGKPDYPFYDAFNPGYGAFKTANANRRTVVYVGANGGMLHAINGALQRTNPTNNTLETDANAGREMFAYVPSAVISGPNNTPAADGLAALGRSPYVHKYFVNSTPVTFDVDFFNTRNPIATEPDWRTILVGGLGKGGKSFYALDVTDPQSMATSESNVVSKVLWEFTDTDMGYSYGAPLIGKTRKYGWVVILTSGYNNGSSLGYLYILNPRTGELLEKIATPTASNGLAQVNGYVESYADNTMDTLYATDLDGNIWRVDVTGITGLYPQPQLLAIARDDDGNRQPITARPVIEADPRTNKRFVMVGTGKLLDTTDIGSTQQQTFYAITDGNGNFGGFAAIASALGKPELMETTDTLTGLNIDFSTRRGWYIDMDPPYRIVSRPTSFYGTVTFVAVAMVNDPCSPSGTSRLFGVDFANAQSLLLSSVTAERLPFIQVSTNVTDIKDLSVNGRREIIFGDDRGGLSQARSAPPPGMPPKRLNWREIQTPN